MPTVVATGLFGCRHETIHASLDAAWSCFVACMQLWGCLYAALGHTLGMQKGALSQAEEERPNRPFLARLGRCSGLRG
jgi:hypothetical protein